MIKNSWLSTLCFGSSITPTMVNGGAKDADRNCFNALLYVDASTPVPRSIFSANDSFESSNWDEPIKNPPKQNAGMMNLYGSVLRGAQSVKSVFISLGILKQRSGLVMCFPAGDVETRTGKKGWK